MVPYYFSILFAESVRRNHGTKDATDKAIQECLSKWFTVAKDRNGGRIKRRPLSVKEFCLHISFL